MTIGYVYVAVNVGFPGRCKIGCTRVGADRRIAALKSHYGTRHHFTEAFSLMVPNPYAVEALAHRRLEHCRDRGTELFVCSAEEGRAALLWATDQAPRFPTMPRPKRATKRWRRARHSHQNWLIIVRLAAVMLSLISLIAITKPELSGLLPDAVQRTGRFLAEHLTSL